LADEFPPQAYVRLAGQLTIDGHNTLPSLWVFLLLVLGILLFIIAATSCSMHWIQRRRRLRLRRRVANGEVDLEQLSIKKLTVPREILDAMPLYTYPEMESEKPEHLPDTNRTPILADSIQESTVQLPLEPEKDQVGSPAKLPSRKTVYSQPSCAICLDDFIPGESIIRELPCHHVFHSECVDTFLRENSSLCPLCKKTSLPRGYCPPIITNVMVRRERNIRRIRDRVPVQREPESLTERAWSPAAWRQRARSALSLASRSRRTTATPALETPAQTTQPVETIISTIPASQNIEPAEEAPAELTPAPLTEEYEDRGPGSEWARQRALAMIGGLDSPDSQATEAQRSRWKRITNRVWPGF